VPRLRSNSPDLRRLSPGGVCYEACLQRSQVAVIEDTRRGEYGTVSNNLPNNVSRKKYTRMAQAGGSISSLLGACFS
jgi:hypothetical protein